MTASATPEQAASPAAAAPVAPAQVVSIQQPKRVPWATVAAIATVVTLIGGFAVDAATERANMQRDIVDLKEDVAKNSKVSEVVAELRPMAQSAAKQADELKALTREVITLGAAVKLQGEALQTLMKELIRDRRRDRRGGK